MFEAPADLLLLAEKRPLRFGYASPKAGLGQGAATVPLEGKAKGMDHF